MTALKEYLSTIYTPTKLDRKSYFTGQLIFGVVIVILFYFANHTNGNAVRPVILIPAVILSLVTIFAAVARLHSANHTGWWYLLPFVTLIMVCQPSSNDRGKWWDSSATVLVILSIIAYAVLGSLPL